MRLIDADELFNQRVYSVRSDKEFPYQKAYKNMLHDIENAPTVDAEPVKHGHWEYQETWRVFECSICNHSMVSKYPYCAWCGAKMDLEDADNDKQ